MGQFSNFHWKDIDKYLLSYGCEFVRQKGSHRIYKKEGVIKLITIPEKKNVSIGVVMQTVRNLNIDKQTFLDGINKI